MPPEQVMRLPSISNSDGTTATSGKASRKAGQVLPMQRGAALIEQTGLGEHVRTAGDAADGDASSRQTPEPGKHGFVVEQ